MPSGRDRSQLLDCHCGNVIFDHANECTSGSRKRTRLEDWILSGVNAGFTRKQVEWLMENFQKSEAK